MKKKIFAVVVMAAMLFSVAGCQSTKKAATETKTASESQTEVRVGSLQGPTSMGLVQLMKESDEKKSTGNYSFSMETQPDAIASKIVYIVIAVGVSHILQHVAFPCMEIIIFTGYTSHLFQTVAVFVKIISLTAYS